LFLIFIFFFSLFVNLNADCLAGTQLISTADECYAVVKSRHEQTETVIQGTWYWVPPGCTVQFWRGRILPHWKSNDGIANCVKDRTGEWNDYNFYCVDQCYTCPRGKYSISGGSCTSCGTSQGNTGIGNHECDVCAKGRFSTPNTYGGRECVDCPIGYYQPYLVGEPGVGATWADACYKCYPGDYADVGGLADCKDCPEGKYTTNTRGNTACANCPIGWGSTSTNIECTQCVAGKISKVLYTLQKADNECRSSDTYLGTFDTVQKCAEKCIEIDNCEYFVYGKGERSGKCYHEKTADISCSEGWISKSYDFYSTNIQCVSCHNGQYTDQEGQSTCKTCINRPSTERTSGTALTTCDCIDGFSGINCAECAKGMGYNGSSCVECVKPQYNNLTTHAATCADVTCGVDYGVALNDGDWNNENLAANCGKCESNEYSPAGQGECAQCVVGRYLDNSSSPKECKDCPAGKYQAGSGKTSCVQCPAGYFTDSAIQITSNHKIGCFKCTVGRYQAETGKTSCNDCPAGKYGRYQGQLKCTDCAAGFYWATYDYVKEDHQYIPTYRYEKIDHKRYKCKHCEDNQYNDEVGSLDVSACKLCPKNTYGEPLQYDWQYLGHASCTACPVNTYTSQEGSRSCTSCPSGKIRRENDTICKKTCASLLYEPVTYEWRDDNVFVKHTVCEFSEIIDNAGSIICDNQTKCTASKCCKPKVKCDSYSDHCPQGRKSNSTECMGSVCTDAECCVPAKCDSYNYCPQGRNPNANSIDCAGSVCTEDDAIICCLPAKCDSIRTNGLTSDICENGLDVDKENNDCAEPVCSSTDESTCCQMNYISIEDYDLLPQSEQEDYYVTIDKAIVCSSLNPGEFCSSCSVDNPKNIITTFVQQNNGQCTAAFALNVTVRSNCVPYLKLTYGNVSYDAVTCTENNITIKSPDSVKALYNHAMCGCVSENTNVEITLAKSNTIYIACGELKSKFLGCNSSPIELEYTKIGDVPSECSEKL
jgi:hypothetical protein